MAKLKIKAMNAEGVGGFGCGCSGSVSEVDGLGLG